MKYIITLILLLSFNFTIGQDPYLQEANEEEEKAAKTLVERYTPKLVLSGNQVLPFESKVTEFLIRKAEVDRLENLSTRKKLRLLRKISNQETAEMRNILTRPQLREYIRIKKDIQPIYVVVD